MSRQIRSTYGTKSICQIFFSCQNNLTKDICSYYTPNLLVIRFARIYDERIWCVIVYRKQEIVDIKRVFHAKSARHISVCIVCQADLALHTDICPSTNGYFTPNPLDIHRVVPYIKRIWSEIPLLCTCFTCALFFKH